MPLPFPNVPNLPGVPPIPRTPGEAIGLALRIALPASISALAQPLTPTTNWGIYDQNNNLIVAPDSILSFDNRNEWDVVNFPVQAGAFASYNKVIIPFELSLRMTKGGSVADRAAFLNEIGAIGGDTNLYNIQTPEQTYSNCNITRYEISRKGAAGAYFFAEVDLFFVQIVQVTPQYTTTSLQTQNAQDASAQPAVNQGNVNPQPVTPGVQNATAPALDYGMVQGSVSSGGWEN